MQCRYVGGVKIILLNCLTECRDSQHCTGASLHPHNLKVNANIKTTLQERLNLHQYHVPPQHTGVHLALHQCTVSTEKEVRIEQDKNKNVP